MITPQRGLAINLLFVCACDRLTVVSLSNHVGFAGKEMRDFGHEGSQKQAGNIAPGVLRELSSKNGGSLWMLEMAGTEASGRSGCEC